tara:strand:- start:594 stop:737 length:144 start_codon:yes stop_codon:yes gene_type:complete
MSKSKLGIGLCTDSTKNTAELKFTDYSINKFQSKFEEEQTYKRTKIR